MEPVTTRLLAGAFLMLITLANVEGTTCYLCGYDNGVVDNSGNGCLNPSSSTATCTSGTLCFSTIVSSSSRGGGGGGGGEKVQQITRGCASGGPLGCAAGENNYYDYVYYDYTLCTCSGDLCNTESTVPAPSDGPATTCYFCTYSNTSPDTSNCLNPSSSTPTCSTGTQCSNIFSSNLEGKQITRGCASGVPLGCAAGEGNYVNGTFCVCSGDLCNTGSTAPAPSDGPATTCYLCTYESTYSDTSNCLNPSSSTPTCNTGTQCSNFFSSVSGAIQVTRGCASGAPLGCEHTEYSYENNTLCVCSSDLCNTGSTAPTQAPATQAMTASSIGGSATPASHTPAPTQVHSGGPATHVGLWNLPLLAFTAVVSFALAQGNLFQ